MRRRPTEQDRAHELLLEWAAGLESAMGYGYPAMPVEPSVQGARPEYTDPERYAGEQSQYEALDRAVRQVGLIDPRWRGTLWQQYVQGRVNEAGMPDEPRMAEDMGVPLATWRKWRDAGRTAFLRAHKGVDGGDLGAAQSCAGRSAP